MRASGPFCGRHLAGLELCIRLSHRGRMNEPWWDTHAYQQSNKTSPPARRALMPTHRPSADRTSAASTSPALRARSVRIRTLHGTAVALCQGLAGRSAGAGRHGRVGRAVKDLAHTGDLDVPRYRPAHCDRAPAGSKTAKPQESSRSVSFTRAHESECRRCFPEMPGNISTGVLLHPV
jgi:hypothetical protein